MNANKESTISKQQLKSQMTKDKIFTAAKEILQKDGYEALSIKRICQEAGVSNGSFYHHFQSKEDLLSYYIEHQPSLDTHVFDLPNNLDETVNSIIQVYLHYAKYCEELGVNFIANYYVPRNQALHPTERTERAYPIIAVQNYLEKALEHNIVQTTYSISELTTDIRMLIIGNVFEWCLNNGKTDFPGNIRRSMSNYLLNVLH